MATDGSLSLSQNDPNYGETMANIGSVNIVVVAEDGTRTVYSTAGATDVLTAKQNALAAAAAKYESKIAAMAEGAQKAAAQAAYNALVQAIESANNLSDVEAIYKNGSFVSTNDTVSKVEDIVINGKATVLPEAVNGVITLTQDVELSARTDLAGEVREINLAGHTLTAADGVSLMKLTESAQVTVKGGTLAAKGTGKGVIVDGSSKLVLDGVTLTSENAPAVMVQVAGGAVEIKGGSITTGNQNAVYVHGNTAVGTRITIDNDAVITGKNGDGLYLAGPAVTNIGKATITGDEAGVEIRAGELYVNGATITSNGTYNAPSSNGNGSTTVGAGIAVAQHTTNQNIVVKVDGGTEIRAQKHIVVARPESTTGGTITVTVADCPAINATLCVNYTEDSFIVNNTPITKVVSTPEGDGNENEEEGDN